MSEDISIIGSGSTTFGKHLDRSEESLTQEAVGKAIQDAEVSPNDIEAVFCGNVFGEMLPGQRATLGMDGAGPPVFNIDNACASSSTALLALI